jgi:hypothetical protein
MNTPPPTSARVAFKLQAWKAAAEYPGYSALNTEPSTIVASFQPRIKEQNIKNIVLDRDVIRVKQLWDYIWRTRK